MKKSTIAKILSIVMAGTMCVSIGALAGCTEGEPNTPGETTHNWATTWTTDATDHWHKCLDLGCTEVKDKAAHTADSTTGKCTECDYQVTTPPSGGDETPGTPGGGDETPGTPGGGDENPVEKTVTVYFYNYNGWTISATGKDEGGDDVLDGATFAAVDGHANWYSITVSIDATKNNFTLNIADTTDANKKVTTSIINNDTIYISENGTYADFAAAEANPPIPMVKTSVHIKKPESWTGTQGVGIYVYGAGEFFGAWPATANTHADPDNDGWLVAEAEIPEANRGAAVTFIIFDIENNDETTGAGRMSGNLSMNEDVYITADGKTFATIDAANTYLSGAAPEGYVYFTLHVKVIFGLGGIPEGGDVYAYSWSGNNNINNQLGGWPGSKLEAEGDGWYSARILVTEAAAAGKDYHIIINNNNGSQYDMVAYSGDAMEIWVTSTATPGKEDGKYDISSTVTDTNPNA